MNDLQKQEAGMLAHMIQRLDKYRDEAETYEAHALAVRLHTCREEAQRRLLRVVGVDDSDDGMEIAEALERADVCAVVHEDNTIANVDPFWVEIEGVYIDNARLFDVAPDLLDAAKRLEQAVWDEFGPVADNVHDAAERVRKIIAEIEGEHDA